MRNIPHNNPIIDPAFHSCLIYDVASPNWTVAFAGEQVAVFNKALQSKAPGDGPASIVMGVPPNGWFISGKIPCING